MDNTCNDMIISNDYLDYIIEYVNIEDELKKLTTIGTNVDCFTLINNSQAVLYIPNSIPIETIFGLFGFGTLPKLFGPLDTGSQEASGISRLRNIPSLNLRGQGVLIGIVDTGIDYNHEAFKNADGTSRIVSIWDQTIQTGPNPADLQYGTEYTKEQINLALLSPDPLAIVPSVDEDGHGTFLAGIAAGTPSVPNNFAGVVPLAELVVVKLKQAKAGIKDYYAVAEDIVCYQENDIMTGVKYLMDTAARLSRPIAVCIGMGTSLDSHDGRGAISTYLSTLGDQNGIAIVIAAGNEGNTGNHYRGILATGTNQSKNIELRVAPNEPGFTMLLWGDAPATYSIDILSPTGEYIPRIPARMGEVRDIRFIFESTVIHIAYLLIETQTGDELIYMRFRQPTEGIWRFKVYVAGDLGSNFHIWLPGKHFLKGDTSFVEADPDYTVTSPGDASIPIVVTAYDYTNGSLFIGASRGYNRNDYIVPNFAAPGVNLVGPAPGNSYTTRTGTSLAAAHTAGIAAILLEWGITTGFYSELDSIEIKNLLIRGAKREPNVTYPNKQWGYGIIDIYNTFNSLRQET
jgi:subtilisin family serine protease